jgi:hypothetical protein
LCEDNPVARGAPSSFARLTVALLIVALIAWGWSYLPGNFHHESYSGRLYLILSEGPIAKFDSRAPEFEGYDAMVAYLGGQAPRNRQWRALGFSLYIGEWPKLLPDSSGGAILLRYVAVIVPYWSIATIAGLVALIALWRVWRRRRSEFHEHCLSCGYDLRFSRDRCPECGSVIPERKAVTAHG